MITTRITKVLDEFGRPVSGAHVYFSSTNGTNTNRDGVASLTGDGFQTVSISYVGKKTVQYTFNNLPQTVILYEDFEGLDEVVITAPKKNETPSYVFPALGAAVLLLALMSLGGNEPQKVTL